MYVPLVVLTVVCPPNGPSDVLRQVAVLVIKSLLHTAKARQVKQTRGYRISNKTKQIQQGFCSTMMLAKNNSLSLP